MSSNQTALAAAESEATRRDRLCIKSEDAGATIICVVESCCSGSGQALYKRILNLRERGHLIVTVSPGIGGSVVSIVPDSEEVEDACCLECAPSFWLSPEEAVLLGLCD